jgi:hypothetical protein
MKKFIYLFAILFTLSGSLMSCREDKSAEDRMEEGMENIEEGAEEVGEDIEEGAEEIEEEIDEVDDSPN